MSAKLDELLSALTDYNEATQERKQMQSEYTVYSPSYHLASWIEAQDNAYDRLEDALNAYIDARIAERLALVNLKIG